MVNREYDDTQYTQEEYERLRAIALQLKEFLHTATSIRAKAQRVVLNDLAGMTEEDLDEF